MQKGYNEIQAVEIELKIIEQTSAPPSRPRKYSDDIKLPLQDTVTIKRVRFVDGC